MRSASAIMKKKRFIKDEMDRRLPAAQSDTLWAQAETGLSEISSQFADIPAGEHTHTDNYIFPAAALYLALRGEIGRETACSVIENAAICSLPGLEFKRNGILGTGAERCDFYIRKV